MCKIKYYLLSKPEFVMYPSLSRRRFIKTLALVGISIPLTKGIVLAQGDEPSLEILPYLQNPTQDTMTVCYVSTDAQDVKVDYFQKGKPVVRNINATQAHIPKTNWSIWKAKLDKLQPGAEYTYRVRYKKDGKELKSENYTFKAFNWNAPETKSIALNDVHNKSDVMKTLLKHVKPDDYEYSLLLGDMWNDPSSQNGASLVFSTLASYVKLLNASTKPMIYIRGNHDTRGDFASHLSHLFDLPNNDPSANFKDQNAYHDFRCGPVWYISPDAGEDFDKRQEIFQPYRERQVDWLKGLFSSSPAKNAPWRIIPLHIPLYTPRGWDQLDASDRWEPILNNERIDVMIAGHDHKPHSVPKGKSYQQKKSERTITPPYPVLVGGGPNMDGGEIGTVMLIQANTTKLKIRMLDTKGKQLHQVSLKK